MLAAVTNSIRQRLTFAKYWLVNVFFRLYIHWHKPKKLYDSPAILSAAAPDSLIRRVGAFIHLTSRYVPGSTCLSRALAAKFVLAQKGFHSVLRVGVTKENGVFLAHAWLMSGENIVVGNESNEIEKFKLMTELGAPGV